MPAPGQPSGKVDFKDFGLAEIREQLEALSGAEITIGWQGPSGDRAHSGGTATNAEIAALHEFGTSRMPARPGLETTLTRHEDEFLDAVADAMSDVLDGRADADDVLERLGELAVARLRETIEDSPSWAEPLAPSTVARKGHDHPLIDTGELRRTASWAERAGDRIIRQGGEK